jgi:transglutaminase-like putative cysteine protease
MRRLTVRHVTSYRYSQPVRFGEHRMMFRPRESHDLRLVSTMLDIWPQPSNVRWVHDVFDNSVAIATFDQAASELRFESTVRLEHLETALPDYALEVGAQLYPFKYSDDEGPDLASALARQFPSDDLTSWTSRFLAPSGSTGTMALLQSMTRAINEEFVYLKRRAQGVQSPVETLRFRSGSCRDFAVFMMEAVRSLGLAARFVSGYIFVPDVDRAEVVGGGATHGWIQAYLPGAGWVDFDPTNSLVGNRNLIRVAVAWDQRNALPLWGTFHGPPSSFEGMDVDVSVTDETGALRLDDGELRAHGLFMSEQRDFDFR